jgi:hypothetical protein
LQALASAGRFTKYREKHYFQPVHDHDDDDEHDDD